MNLKFISDCNKVKFSHFFLNANCLVSLFIVYAKAKLWSTGASDLSGTHWWFWHQCSDLMGKVTNLPKTWFVHFHVLTLTASFSPFISFRETERGGCRSVIHGHISLVSLIQTKTPWGAPRVLPSSLLSLSYLCLLFLSSHLVKGGRANTLLTQAPSDRWGRRGLRCHWLTAGESAMRIGGCRGIGMKTCVRRHWCWWRSCASTPQEGTARANAARSSATCWEAATEAWTQVTDPCSFS